MGKYSFSSTIVNNQWQTFIAICSVLLSVNYPHAGAVTYLTKRRDLLSENIGEPFFAEQNTTDIDVVAQEEITTYLHCKVNSLGGKTVSWLKRHGDTPHLITFGLTTYSSDARFQIYHESNDWQLQIQYPRKSDAGLYECLVSSNPPIVRRTRLVVIAPTVDIVDERNKKITEKFYKGGSTIELKCVIRQIVGKPPEYIIWHHEQRMLNYDTERGGISVKTNLLKEGAVSRLFIAFASTKDSGNYTCSMRHAQASVMVHILNGENPAAIQAGTSHRTQSTAPILELLVLLGTTQWFLQNVNR